MTGPTIRNVFAFMCSVLFLIASIFGVQFGVQASAQTTNQNGVLIVRNQTNTVEYPIEGITARINVYICDSTQQSVGVLVPGTQFQETNPVGMYAIRYFGELLPLGSSNTADSYLLSQAFANRVCAGLVQSFVLQSVEVGMSELAQINVTGDPQVTFFEGESAQSFDTQFTNVNTPSQSSLRVGEVDLSTLGLNDDPFADATFFTGICINNIRTQDDILTDTVFSLAPGTYSINEINGVVEIPPCFGIATDVTIPENTQRTLIRAAYPNQDQFSGIESTFSVSEILVEENLNPELQNNQNLGVESSATNQPANSTNLNLIRSGGSSNIYLIFYTVIVLSMLMYSLRILTTIDQT